MKGVELRRLRDLNGRTLEQLAEQMGVSRQAIAQIEKRDDIQPDTVARYLGAMLGFDVVAIATTFVWETASGDPIYHEKTKTAVKVKE